MNSPLQHRRWRLEIKTRGVLTLALLSVLLIAASVAQSQTETVLYNFCSDPGCGDGELPLSSLTANRDFYRAKVAHHYAAKN